jgi:hypothetical protein
LWKKRGTRQQMRGRNRQKEEKGERRENTKGRKEKR